MFGTQWTKSKRKTERVASEAWDNLLSAVGSAGDTAKDTAKSVGRRTSDLADDAQNRVSSVADEAWSRANMALDALSGRKARKPWGWIGVAVLAGVALGWAVAATAPKAVSMAVDKFSDDEPPIGGSGSSASTGGYSTPGAARTTGSVPSGPSAG